MPDTASRPRWPRRLLVLAMPVLVLLAGALSVPLWIDRLGLREQAAGSISQALGQPVRIDGPTRLHWWPTPRLVFGPLAGTAAAPAVDAGELELLLDPLALAGPLAGPRSAVRGARLRAARLAWHTPDGADWLSLTSAELRLDPADAPGATTLYGIVRVNGRAPDLAGELRLDGVLRPPTDAPGLLLEPLRLSGQDLRVGEGRGLALDLTTRGRFDPATGTLALPDLQLTSAGLAVAGAISLTTTSAGPSASGRLTLAPVDLRDWLWRHGYGPGRGAADRLRQVAATAALSAGLAPDGPWVVLDQASLRLDDSLAGLSGWLRWSATPGAGGGIQPPAGLVTLVLDQLDLDAYLVTPTVVPASITPAAASASDLAGAPVAPALTGDLAPPPPADAAAPMAAPVANQPATLQLRLHAGALRLGGPMWRDLTLAGALSDRELGLVAAAALYGGRFNARFTLTLPDLAAGALVPALALAGEAQGVDLGALLADLPGARVALTGTSGARFDLRSRGLTAADLRGALAGEVALVVVDGTIPGLELDQLLARATGRAVGSGGGGTRFSRLRASASGSAGRFVTEDIDGASERLRLAGQGEFDLTAATLALGLRATLVRPPDGSGIRELEGIPIPITVRGPWAAPQWQVDLAGALAEAARRALTRDDGNLLDDLERQLGVPGLRQGLERGLEQGLRGLLGR